MRYLVCGLLFVSMVACAGDSPKEIRLSKPEQELSIKLVERDQEINLRRQKAQQEFQAVLNRLQEEQNAVALDRQKLCFELKRAHKLDPLKNYTIDEFKGVLVIRN